MATICRRTGAVETTATAASEASSSSSLSALRGSSAMPSPSCTMRLAASIESSTMTPRGETPAARNIELVSSW